MGKLPPIFRTEAAKITGIGIASGASANVIGTNINRSLAVHQQNKLNTYKRKLPSGKTVRVMKSPYHGVGRGQRKRPQPVVVVNNPTTGGGY